MRRLRGLPWKRLAVLGGSVVLVALALVVTAYVRTGVPTPSAASVEQTTVVRYAGGEEMARLGTNRQLVELSAMSEPAQQAVLAAEDRGFYSEPGISPRGIARALLTNVRGGGGVQQGGSTITQQYAKNAFLTSERTYERKVKEVFIALKMTRQLSKEQILEDYLNTIYFGRGAYGIEAASKAYFGPDATAATLTPARGAVLASSIRAPALYDPARHPERARERFAYVLDGMVGQGWLTAQDRAATAYPEVVESGEDTAEGELSGPEGHVVAAVVDELTVRGFAEDELTAGGLEVQTTVQKGAQDAAVAAVQEVTGDDMGGELLQGALVAVDPRTGAVRAYYGGANGNGIDYAGGVVRQPGDPGVKRQPGSSFKPYVLATALSQGIPLSSRWDGNTPKAFPGVAAPGIRNFDTRDRGRVDLVQATAQSINTAYFELGLEVGPQAVAQTAHAAGIPADVMLANPDNGAVEGGISLGQYEVHVTDQAVGYGAFANGGQTAAPHLVASVQRDGEQVYAAAVTLTRAFDEDVAADATFAMQQVVRSGSGTGARLAGGRPAAGKTGTTSDNKDTWFVGFTPQLSAAVWFGYGTPRTVEIDGSEATGGRVNSAVWKEFVDAALVGQPEEEFPPRADVGRRARASQEAATRRPAPRRSASPAPRRSAGPAPTRSASPAPSPTATRTPSATPTPVRTSETSEAPTEAPSEEPTAPPASTPAPRATTPPPGTPSAPATATGARRQPTPTG